MLKRVLACIILCVPVLAHEKTLTLRTYWRPAIVTIVRLFAALITLFHLGTTTAAVVVVDFESSSEFTTPASAGPAHFGSGVVLSAGTSLNEFEFPPHSGTNVLSDLLGPIHIAFAAPVSHIAWFMTYTKAVTVEALLADGSTLGWTSLFTNNLALSGDLGSAPNEFGELLGTNIIDITFTGLADGASLVIDDLTFEFRANFIPEPSSIAMVLIGLVGILKMRDSRRSSVLALTLFGSFIAAANAASLEGLALAPSALKQNSSQFVTATVRSSDSNLIVASVNLYRTDPTTGRAAALIGRMKDDGTDGDVAANDGIFTLRFAPPASASGTVGYRATAALKGQLLRATSFEERVTISTKVDASLSQASVTSNLVSINDGSGALLYSRALTKDIESTLQIDGVPMIEVRSERAFTSAFGTAALVHSSGFYRSVVPPAGDEEYAPAPDQILMVRGGGVAWSRNSGAGFQFLVTPGMTSGNGERTVLVLCNETCINPQTSVVNGLGATILSINMPIGYIDQLLMSEDGGLVAFYGRPATPSTPPLAALVVLNTVTGQLFSQTLPFEAGALNLIEYGSRMALTRGSATIVLQLP